MSIIHDRRSIRKFKDAPIPHGDIEKIISAGMQAPSTKNNQPWRFVVVENDAKADMLFAMEKGLEQELLLPKLPDSGRHVSSARHTMSIMAQAPVTIFIINPLNKMECLSHDWESRIFEVANIQSVGACIQNMLLQAVELGYGSLWNCNIYLAYHEISAWLETEQQVVAAVSFGIPNEQPNARPRKGMHELVEWKSAKKL